MPKKSTIVPKIAQQTLRFTTSGAERLNPDWSAALAERLWFHAGRPPKHAIRNRHPVQPGTAFTIRFNNADIRGLHWGDPAAPVAYLIHGWGGWWQQLGAFVPVLLAGGYRVVTFDALAHGDSGPGAFGRRSSSVPEMAAAYAAVVERFGAPAATVAHSLGCLSVLWAQRLHGIVPELQVLVAPAASTQGMLDVFTRAVGLGPASIDPLERRFQARIGRPLRDFDLLPLVAAERLDRGLPPALIVHDTADRRTSPAESEILAGAWPGSQLLLTTGHGHHRVLRAPEVLAATAEFLARQDVRLTET